METLQRYLQSTTNRLVAAIVIAHVLTEALFAGAPSGFELYPLESPKFQLWQLVSYLFQHGSWWHLGFNMLALWSFGQTLERVWGGRRLLFFFLVCGVGAGVAHLAYSQFQYAQLTKTLLAAGMSPADLVAVAVQGQDLSAQFTEVSTQQLRELWVSANLPTVGASGAVYGVLVAFALLFPSFKIMLVFLPIPIAARYFVPVLLLIDLTAELTGVSIFGHNIAHVAHLGGALVGFVLVQFWLQKIKH